MTQIWLWNGTEVEDAINNGVDHLELADDSVLVAINDKDQHRWHGLKSTSGIGFDLKESGVLEIYVLGTNESLRKYGPAGYSYVEKYVGARTITRGIGAA